MEPLVADPVLQRRRMRVPLNATRWTVKEVRMRKAARQVFGPAAVLALLLGLSCKSGYQSTSEVSIHGQDLVYLHDQRTDLCFAVLALQNPAGTSIRELTMASVPCEKLSGVPTQ